MAFRAACKTHGVRSVEHSCAPNLQAARALGKCLGRRDDRPNTIILFSDYIATGFIRGLRDVGLSVPGDMAVVGIDNTETGEFGYVSLTSMGFDTRRMIVEAVGMLIDMQENADYAPREICLPTSLVVREST
jgi:LacI family transcriptional regulator